MHKLSISVLDANFSKEQDWLPLLEASSIEYLHWDIMDGVYVPKKTFEAEALKEFRKKTKLPFDVHFMVDRPEAYFYDFHEVCDIFTFHPECSRNPEGLIQKIHSEGKKAGICINNRVPIQRAFPFLGKVELILIMSVEAGLGGQRFNPLSLGKLKLLGEELNSRKLQCLVEVDGGVNNETALSCVQSGANMLVSGSYVLKSLNIAESIRKLRFE